MPGDYAYAKNCAIFASMNRQLTLIILFLSFLMPLQIAADALRVCEQDFLLTMKMDIEPDSDMPCCDETQPSAESCPMAGDCHICKTAASVSLLTTIINASLNPGSGPVLLPDLRVDFFNPPTLWRPPITFLS